MSHIFNFYSRKKRRFTKKRNQTLVYKEMLRGACSDSQGDVGMVSKTAAMSRERSETGFMGGWCDGWN